MHHLLALADSVPPALPSWLWVPIVAGALGVLGPIGKGIVGVTQYFTKKDAPIAQHQTQLDAHAKVMSDHESADKQRHADVAKWFEETKQSQGRIEKTITEMRDRLTRIETVVEERTSPGGGVREPTGQHKPIRG